MKQILLFLFTTLNLLFVKAQVAPTNPCTNVSFSNVEGASIILTLTKAASGGGTSRIIVAKKGEAVTAKPVDGNDYAENSNFNSGFQLSPSEFVVYDGTSTTALIQNLEPNTTYHFAVYEYNGAGVNIKYLSSQPFIFSKASASTPTAQTENITFSKALANSVQINWQVPAVGGGTGRLIVVKAGAPVDATVIPQDLQIYNPSSSFSFGHQFAGGNFVVYRSTGTSITIENLQPNTTYHIAAFEYNGISKPVYLSSNPARSSFTTAARPYQFVSNLTTMSYEGNKMNVRWTDGTGNGIGRLVIAREGEPVTAVPVDGENYSTANSSFGDGPAILPGQHVVYKGSSYNFDIRNLKPGTTYYFTVFEYANSTSGSVYYTAGAPTTSGTTLSAPTLQASNLAASNVTNNSLTLTWTQGNGDGQIIIGKKGSPVNALPANFTFYSSSASFGNVSNAGIIKGSDNTDNYVVYLTKGTTTSITGLQSATDYHFAIFEYKGYSAPVFNTTNPSTTQQTTASRPSLGTSNLTFNSSYVEGNSLRMAWNNGNGIGRLIVARKGAAVVNKPADYTTYSAKPQFGTGAELVDGSGEFVVADITSASADFTVTGLEIGATYYFAVFEYAGSGLTREYLTTTGSYATNFKATYAAPTAGPSGLTIDNVTNTSMRLNWTNATAAAGGGTARLVIAKEGTGVDITPANLTFYPNSTNFGSSKMAGTENSAVYYGSANSVTISGLKPGTAYHFKIVEANGNSGPVYYNAAPVTGTQTTTATPSSASTGFTPSSLESNSVSVSWSSSSGTGSKRIIVAREGAAVSAIPVNGSIYTPDASFGSSTPISSGEFVVYNGAVTSAPVTNLQPGRTYHFRVYEYNEVNGTPYYLTSAFLTGSITTKSKPVQQAANISFSAFTSTSATISWTAVAADNYLVVAKTGQEGNFTPTDLAKYGAHASYSSATSLGNGHYAVYAGSSNSVNVTGLTTGTTYHFTVFAYNGTNGPSYNTIVSTSNAGSVTTLGAPANQANTISFGTYANGTLQLNWAAGSGNRRLVLAKESSAVNVQPINNTDYTPSSVFKAGQELGTGNYVVYNGNGTSVTISGLDNKKAYHFAIYEYNQFGPSSNSYLTINPAIIELPAVTPLPVNWVAFSGAASGNQVRLEWITAQEINNSGYEVERSSDGFSFVRIGTIVPSSTFIYKYIDAHPLQGFAYYRIKQLDQDGTASYSKTIKIQSADKISLIRLLQNPVHSQLKLQGSPLLLGGKLHIIDAEGKTLRVQTISTILQVVDVSFLKKSIYYIQVVNKEGEKQIALPFIKDY